MRAEGENPDALVDLYVDAINQAVANRPADMVIGVHMCRGNYKGMYLSEGGYTRSRSACSSAPTSTTSCWSTTRRARATSRP